LGGFIGGGLREKVFWRNYFFHCAYTRYEAGLSIDEIWSEQALEERKTKTSSPPSSLQQQKDAETTPSNIPSSTNDNTVEETITFEPDVLDEESGVDGKNTTVAVAGASASLFTEVTTNESKIHTDASESAASDFEMVANTKTDTMRKDGNVQEEEEVENLALGGDEDYELDELEAEIARELEDD
jgi:hypothetical protein